MRAVAQYGEYGIQIRPQRQQGLGDGTVHVTQEPIYAKFSPARETILDAELLMAEDRFGFKGLFQHIDEATPLDPIYRISVLDTEQQGWDVPTRELVEEELRRLETLTPDFFISGHRPLNPPYPAWDTADKPAFQLVADLVEMGFDLQAALDYERGYGPARDSVIEALEETIRDQAVETVSA